ncbi:MAG TPA: TlpA disulfide reductase family protein [Terriglobales bacterium]|nr:TlpA disulfide reductase family protein [Terriglobales bacterium]
MRRTLIPALLLLALALAGCSRRALPGRPAPDFHLTLRDGRAVSLASYRGKVVLLNFWASWCPPCVEETPALNALAQEFPKGNVVVLGVSIDEDPVAYRTFLANFHIAFPTARDPSQALMHRYGTVQIPETYIIAPDGRIARKLVSAADWTAPDMVAYLRRLAAGG